jgi:hypothetical protein
MDNATLKKKKQIALIGTVLSGFILLAVFLFLQFSKETSSEIERSRAPFKELYTTLLDTTQQYFLREK